MAYAAWTCGGVATDRVGAAAGARPGFARLPRCRRRSRRLRRGPCRHRADRRRAPRPRRLTSSRTATASSPARAAPSSSCRRITGPRRSRLRPAHRPRAAAHRPRPHRRSHLGGGRASRRHDPGGHGAAGATGRLRDHRARSRRRVGGGGDRRARDAGAGELATCSIAAGDEVLVDPRGLEPRWSRAGATARWLQRLGEPARERHGVRAAIAAAAGRTHGLRADVCQLRKLGHPAHLRRGVVPARRRSGWRPYGHGSWRHTRYGWTWIDLPSVGLAGASLRTLGPSPVAWLVLDAAARMGASLGRLGGRGQLHRLGAARLELAAGRRLLRRRTCRSIRCVGRQLVGRAAAGLRRPRAGGPALCRCAAAARPGAGRLRGAGARAARPRRLGTACREGTRLWTADPGAAVTGRPQRPAWARGAARPARRVTRWVALTGHPPRVTAGRRRPGSGARDRAGVETRPTGLADASPAGRCRRARDAAAPAAGRNGAGPARGCRWRAPDGTAPDGSAADGTSADGRAAPG